MLVLLVYCYDRCRRGDCGRCQHAHAGDRCKSPAHIVLAMHLLNLRHPNYGAMRRREQEPSTPSIGQVFAKLKTLLRRTAPRTADDICKAIGQLLDSFTP